ncbi:hypothetical protein DPMN_071098 [Dreissena polymorpha]|uniref:Uncharacterized protein n=1 Tax=Dreissena polymorpha TaxID=45954 RepID=A0A9D3Z3Y4_DREPO|nr:hypothetical protein DPMN_071098 [Dreissena polymorpha]
MPGLSYNQLRNISRATFSGLIKLQYLYLHSNALESIDDGVFAEVPNLTTLWLSDNKLRNISRATFRGLIKLQTLILENNALESIDDGVFAEVTNLNRLGNEVHINQMRLITCSWQFNKSNV